VAARRRGERGAVMVAKSLRDVTSTAARLCLPLDQAQRLAHDVINYFRDMTYRICNASPSRARRLARSTPPAKRSRWTLDELSHSSPALSLADSVHRPSRRMRPPARLSSLLVALLAALCLPAVRVHAQLFPVIEPFPLLRAYVSRPRPRLSVPRSHSPTRSLTRSRTLSTTSTPKVFGTSGPSGVQCPPRARRSLVHERPPHASSHRGRPAEAAESDPCRNRGFVPGQFQSRGDCRAGGC